MVPERTVFLLLSIKTCQACRSECTRWFDGKQRHDKNKKTWEVQICSIDICVLDKIFEYYHWPSWCDVPSRTILYGDKSYGRKKKERERKCEYIDIVEILLHWKYYFIGKPWNTDLFHSVLVRKPERLWEYYGVLYLWARIPLCNNTKLNKNKTNTKNYHNWNSS